MYRHVAENEVRSGLSACPRKPASPAARKYWIHRGRVPVSSGGQTVEQVYEAPQFPLPGYPPFAG